MARDEVPDMLRDRDAFDIAASSDFVGDIFRDVFGPVLQRVEGDDAYRIVELPRQEISDDGFDVRSLNLDFTVDAAFRSKAIDYEVDRLICPSQFLACSPPIRRNRESSPRPGLRSR